MYYFLGCALCAEAPKSASGHGRWEEGEFLYRHHKICCPGKEYILVKITIASRVFDLSRSLQYYVPSWV